MKQRINAQIAIRGAEYCSCYYCGKHLPRVCDRTVDHVVPAWMGGDKFVTACKGCNNLKGESSLEEFRDWLSEGSSEVVVFHGEKMRWEAW